MPRRPRKTPYPVPKLPPHWHDGPCSCVPGVAYIRVSMVGKRDRIISPDLQLVSIVDYAKANNIRLVAIYSDIDRSGRTFRKRSVDRMIVEIKEGDFQRVILWKWSRWARNVYESTKYLKFVKDAGGRVDSATEDLDQTTALGRLQMDLVMRFDQFVSEQIGESWNATHGMRREAGLPHSGSPRFGYDYVRREEIIDGEKNISVSYEINEVQASAVAAAYDKINSGISWGKTAAWLNDQGLRTTQDELWCTANLSRMMDTGFAAGLIRERSDPGGETPKRVRIQDFDIWRKGAHRPIIERETWERYRKLRESRSRFATRSVAATHDPSGLLGCAECLRQHGKRITLQAAYSGKRPSLYWRCMERGRYHPDVSVTVSNRLAVDSVREWVRDVAGVGEDVDPQARMLFERRMDEDPNAPDPEQINTKIRKWKGRLKNLRDLVADGDITREEFRESREECDTEIGKLKTLLGDLAKSAKDRPDYTAFRTLDELWSSLEPGKMRDPLAELVEVILVSPRKGSEATRDSAAERMEFVGRWDSARISEIQ